MMGYEVLDKEEKDRGRGAGPDPDRPDCMISELFRAYFNDKMTFLIFLIQAKNFRANQRSLEGVFRFLDDLYHYRLTEKIQEEYHDALEWLKSFFRAVPDVSQEERDQAKGFICGLCHATGEI